MNRLLSYVVIAASVLLSFYCTHTTNIGQGGGGSEVEVVGRVFLAADEPAPATQVKLIPKEYDPSFMAAIDDSLIDTSDSQGRYSFKNIAPGTYNVVAVQLKLRTRLLVTGLEVDSGTTTVPSGALQEPGIIRLLFIDRTEHNGYLIIPGTDIAVFVAAGSREFLLDSVPAGRIPEVRYKVLGDSTAVSKRDVEVIAASTTTLVSPAWHHQCRIHFNTTAAGAGVSGNVYGFPVLVRLAAEYFDFAEAKSDGADIRFTSSNGRTLSFEIEQWDSAAKKAAIWVNVDTVYGNDSSQSITMYWGASTGSAAGSTSPKVFDTAAGFQGVWHLGEGGNNTAHDATSNGFDGLAFNLMENGAAPGAIGNAGVFDGDSSYITMPGTANGALNFPQDGFFTVSAWVYADSFDHVFRTVLTKGYEQYFLQLSYFPGDKPLWQFSTFKESATWNMSHTPAMEKQWVLLTGVRQGTVQSLYLNGELVLRTAATDAAYPHPDVTILRNTANDFCIGRFLQEAMYPTRFGYCFFKGKIDEVRACSVARSSDWIKLCYMNQRNDDRLVQFK